MYRIRILDAAADELSRLDTPLRRRAIERINWLVANVDAIRLEGLTGDHADRKDRIRIISARRATRKETHEYEEGSF